MKNPGRKIKLSEEKVKEIIYLFKEEGNFSGKIKYAEIHQFAQSLYKEGRLEINTSDSFWRKSGRLGRTKVDEANRLFATTMSKSLDNEITTPNITNIVNKTYENKDNLLKSLLPIERQITKLNERQLRLKQKNKEYQDEIISYKENLEKINNENGKLKSLVFELYYYILNEANESTNKLADIAMKDLFNDPIKYYNNFKKEEFLSQEEQKIIPINHLEKNEERLSEKFKKRFN